MGFSVGIVGLPNVGKSTLFKALTKKEIDISNYPFCTIDPNIGIVKVPDKRLQKLSEFSKSKKIIPTAIEFVDIAGLVKDAHKGEGLGNKFLSNIREVDMIVHIVRGFEDRNITHVSGKTDPKDDIETINLELILADLETINKSLSKIQKDVKAGKKEAMELQNILEKYKLALEDEKFANSVELDENEKKAIKELQLLTNKPVFYIVNVNENQKINVNEVLSEINNKIFLPIKFELDLSELSIEEAQEFKAETKLDENISSLDDLIVKCYDLLGLITFLTTGEDETRAWTVRKDSTAPQAGRAIHGDFEKKFIRASIINWQKLLDSGSWQNATEKGLLRTEGKEYIVQDGDVIEFKI
ncbi:MAG: redox-regulated ATPase YchF [Candidatus Andersenbacteria bacterium]|nr:redox-regulated ATPase YchF [Candidatus Andersenbacteria bacterium]